MRRSRMFTTGVLAGASTLALVISACGGSDPPPPTAPTGTAYPPQGGYPQQPQQGYPQQPQQGYPQQPQQGYPQQPATPTPAAGGQMAQPGPLALPCQNDGACGLHRCNTQFQKCAFPCQTPVDCAQGNNCMMGVCVPGAPTQ